MTVVKVQRIYEINGCGVYATKNIRFDVEMTMKKVCKYCLKNGFSFKVGFRNNTLLPNKKYIEITDESFLHFRMDDYDYYYEKQENLIEWLKKKGKGKCSDNYLVEKDVVRFAKLNPLKQLKND